jgi:16S rRNA (guanine527-N7)-methyltransferase
MAGAINRAEFGALLVQGAEALKLKLSDSQQEKLLDYLTLLLKWNAVYNLTAVRDPRQMLTQHLLDAMSALKAFGGARQVLDVGSGGGLPGMVLAIWAAEAEPQMVIHMLDTVHKKTAFLTQVKAELGLTNTVIHTDRVEKFKSHALFDVITSRAFAELTDFVNWSGHLLQEGGCMIALKGQAPVEEITRLPAGWVMQKLEPLVVPGMDASRHLVFIKRQAEA